MRTPNPGRRPIYEFGDYVLESAQRRVVRRETREPVALTPKAFDTLLFLVENRGEMQTKDALLAAVWPGVIVEENSLTQTISTLRQALGETRGENRYIATVPRRGYQFVAEVAERDPDFAVPAQIQDSAPPLRLLRPRRWFWVSAAAVALVACGVAFLSLAPVENPLKSVLGGTKDTETYRLYANGTYALSRSNEASLALAIDYFGQAITRDPGFALAHAGVANAYTVLGVFGMRAPGDTFPRGRDAALKAMQLEPRLASAYAALGHIKLQFDRDWAGAEADLRHAIALDPALPEPHLYLGALLTMRGDLEGGLAEVRLAEQLEPLLTLSKTRSGSMLYFARRFDEAETEFKASLALDDRPAIAHRALGRLYAHTGRFDLALEEFARSEGISPGSYADVPVTLALSGRREEACAELDRLLELSRQRYIPAVDIAAIYANLGDADQAIAALERALLERSSTLGFLAQNPAFDPIHQDPRFADIVTRIGVWKRPLTP